MRSFFYIKNIRSKKGFSLSELLISIGIMAFVATVAIGGLVVLANVRERINRQNQAEMIMVATVSYLRADLNYCSGATLYNMNCSSENDAKKAPYIIVPQYPDFRYSDFIIRKNKDSVITAVATKVPDIKVYYWNSTPSKPTTGGENPKKAIYGIWVRVECSDYSVPSGWSKPPYKGRSYVIAQNVMAGTGMYSQIKDGKIEWDADANLYKFTVEVVDEKTSKVILSQYVEVCPDTLLPYTGNP